MLFRSVLAWLAGRPCVKLVPTSSQYQYIFASICLTGSTHWLSSAYSLACFRFRMDLDVPVSVHLYVPLSSPVSACLNISSHAHLLLPCCSIFVFLIDIVFSCSVQVFFAVLRVRATVASLLFLLFMRSLYYFSISTCVRFCMRVVYPYCSLDVRKRKTQQATT